MSPPDINELWDDEEEKDQFSTVMYPFMVAGFLKGATEVAGHKKGDELFTGFKKNEYLSKSLHQAALTVGTTKEMLQTEIDAAIENGESSKQLAKRIDTLFGRSMGYRSLRVARTQLTDTIGDGNLAALVAEGKTEKEWSTVIDGRERETHHNANGQIVDIRQPFIVGGHPCQRPGDDSLPPEESINCRCDIVAPRTSDRGRLVHGRLFLRVHGVLERRYVVSLRRAFRQQRERILSRFPSP